MKTRRHGFTLIELLVVMAIITILAAILVPLAPKMILTAKKNRARGEVNAIATAVKAFYNDYSKFPTAAQGNSNGAAKNIIKVLTDAPGQTANHRHIVYLETESRNLTSGDFLDPWGRQYQIYMDVDSNGANDKPYDGKVTYRGSLYNTECIAVSPGPNGSFGDADDIYNVKDY